MRYLKKMMLPARTLLCLLCLALAVPAPAADLEAAFSPYGNSLELILSAIKSARESIHVATYSFTSKPVAEALLAVHKRGLDVRIVADKRGNSDKYTAVTFLANQGVPVRLNGKYAIHHHKFLIVDGKHLQTGSFNYSAAAVEKNAENVLVIWNAPELAAQYEHEWIRLWKEGEAAGARLNRE
jgi:phosphatidylserine/phosphatidylglycerophosphate/cardiolipin synthase-like enzyme